MGREGSHVCSIYSVCLFLVLLLLCFLCREMEEVSGPNCEDMDRKDQRLPFQVCPIILL